jgi:WD40-like Beta Propeller Repeat
VKKSPLFLLCLFLGAISSAAQPAANDFPKLTGPYLGQKPPGKTAEPFAKDIIAAKDFFHGSVVFTPDGNEAYWAVMDKGMHIKGSKRVNGIWTKPELLYPNADVPFISPDGRKFYFVAQRRDGGLKSEVPSVMDRTPTGWSEPHPLPDIIRSIPNIHWQLSVDRRENLYFGARSGSQGSREYWAEFVDGAYRAPRIIEEMTDIESFSPFIAADGSYLIVTSFQDGLGLYISFKKPDGTWTRGKNISENIGAAGEVLCPVVTHDGKYLFFLKGEGERTIPYWVDASFIEDLRKIELAR